MKPQIEPILTTRDSSLLSRRFEEITFTHPYHYHPEIEITFIAESRGTRIIGDHFGNFEPNDLCLIGSNLPHIYRNSTKPSNQAISEVLHFSLHTANDFLNKAPELSPFKKLLFQSQVGLRFNQQTAIEAGKLLIKLRKSHSLRKWIYFLELADLLIHSDPPKALASQIYNQNMGQGTTSKISQACQYIIDHFDQDIRHEELAKKFNISPPHFSRIFKQATRRTFIDFLSEIRFGHASRLLIESDLSILDIAFASGFRNLSNFNRRFRTRYHCSPKTFRQQFR